MNPEIPSLLRLIADSVVKPREAAATILRLNPPRAVLFESVVLVAALGALLVAFAGDAPVSPPPDEAVRLPGPLLSAALMAASVVLSASALHAAGRILGGRGTFDQTLALMVWLEVVALAIKVVQAFAALLAPTAAGILQIAGLAVLLWCLANFIHVLHGFSGLGRTFLCLLLGSILVAVGLLILLSALDHPEWLPNA